MRKDDECEYREGVVLDRPSKPGKGSLVNCGMWKVSRCLDMMIKFGNVGSAVELFGLRKLCADIEPQQQQDVVED